MIRKEMISDFQENKALVLKLYQELDKANGNDINQSLENIPMKIIFFAECTRSMNYMEVVPWQMNFGSLYTIH